MYKKPCVLEEKTIEKRILFACTLDTPEDEFCVDSISTAGSQG